MILVTGGGVELSNIALVRKLLDMLHRPHSLIDFVEDRAGHDLRYSIDCSKIKDQLGYAPKFNIESGLEKTIRWYQNTHV